MRQLLNSAFEAVDMDLLMILGTVCFFVIAIGYTFACDKLK